MLAGTALVDEPRSHADAQRSRSVEYKVVGTLCLMQELKCLPAMDRLGCSVGC